MNPSFEEQAEHNQCHADETRSMIIENFHTDLYEMRQNNKKDKEILEALLQTPWGKLKGKEYIESSIKSAKKWHKAYRRYRINGVKMQENSNKKEHCKMCNGKVTNNHKDLCDLHIAEMLADQEKHAKTNKEMQHITAGEESRWPYT